MNEQFKELAEQAQQYAEYVTPQGLEWFDTFKEKFADLIVKECSYLADQAHHKATGGKSAGGYIRQHFGVEQ